MPGIPQFDRASLARLRRLVQRLARKQTRMPMRDLVALGSEALPGQWRIDLDASHRVLVKTGLSNRAAIAAAVGGR